MNLTKYWKSAAIGLSATLGVAVIAGGGITSTADNEVRLLTQGGDVVGDLSNGYGLKIPFVQHTYDLRSDVIEIAPEPIDIAIQNGTITAEKVNGKAFIRLNGSHADRVETAKLIYNNMNDFKDRLTSLTEKAMRDVIRETIVVTTDDITKPEDASGTVANTQVAATSSKPNFLDSSRIGSLIQESLQSSIQSIIPGEVNTGTVTSPHMVSRIEVTQVAVGDFTWDKAYQDKQHNIQEARSKAEQARYAEQEKLRTASGTRAEADGQRDADKARGEGRASAILAEQNAIATGIKNQIEAAGGADSLVRILQARNWNGSLVTVSGGTPIVDTRQNGDKGAIIPAPFAPTAPNP